MRSEINTADLFCGAGGASTGLELAIADLGLKHSGVAVNHWQVAIATHQANHPSQRHLCAAVESLVPADVIPSGNLDLLWASPSCTHHSRARGGKPCSNQMRAQPDLILSWLDQLFVRRMIVENVPEFVEWGPLSQTGRPLQSKRGACFDAWLASIEARNYKIEHRILNCADYGDATTRKRFFLQAVRRGCGKIEWPEPSHSRTGATDLFGSGANKWRGIDTCLDWSDLGTPISARKRPLAANTMRRIEEGVRKFGCKPFVMDFLGTDKPEAGGRLIPPCMPIPPIHAGGQRFGLAQPFIIGQQSCSAPRSTKDPLPTCSASGAIALCTPFLIPMEHSQRSRLRGVEEPLPTITTAKGGSIGLATPFIFDFLQHGGAKDVRDPLGAQASHERFALATPYIVQMNQHCAPRPVDEPLPTVAASGEHFALAVPVGDGRVVVDVLFRMLKPEELAAAHSFPKSYFLAGTRTEKTKQIGNSVPVETARAIGRAALRDVAIKVA